jgi:hypothetical protein
VTDDDDDDDDDDDNDNNNSLNTQLHLHNREHDVAHLVEALCYKADGRGFDSRYGHWNFSLTNPPAALWSWGRPSL